MPPLLVSIKPRYIERILTGTKTVELRKRSARIEPGTHILLYSTAPTCAVVGEARIAFRERLALDELWDRHGAAAAGTRAEFDAYYACADEGVTLGLQDVHRYTRSLSLGALRRADAGFRPPQSSMQAPRSLARLLSRLRRPR